MGDDSFHISIAGAGDQVHGRLGGPFIRCHYKNTWFAIDPAGVPDDWNLKYKFPHAPGAFNVLDILLAQGLAPKLDNFYRDDMSNPPDYAFCVGTHPHHDHNQYYTLIRPDITKYIGREALYLEKILQHAGNTTRNQQIDMIGNRLKLPSVNGGERFARGLEAFIPRDIRIMEDDVPFTHKDVTITPSRVDHSTFAHALEIETDFLTDFSGDFRMRGRHPERTYNFLEKMRNRPPKYFFMEGSLFHFNHRGTEQDLEDRLVEHLKGKNFAALHFSVRDLEDRFVSVYNACKRVGRMLLINSVLAKMLMQFNGRNGIPTLDDQYIGVFMPPMNTGSINNPKADPERVRKDYFKYQRDLLDIKRWSGVHEKKAQLVYEEDVKNNKDKFVMFFPFSYFSKGILERIKPGLNSTYVRLAPAPFTIDMESDERIIVNNLIDNNMYGGFTSMQDIPDVMNPEYMRHVVQIHVNGHLNFDEAVEIVASLPDSIVLGSYHTMFNKYFYDIAGKKKLILPNKDQLLLLDGLDPEHTRVSFATRPVDMPKEDYSDPSYQKIFEKKSVIEKSLGKIGDMFEKVGRKLKKYD